MPPVQTTNGGSPQTISYRRHQRGEWLLHGWSIAAAVAIGLALALYITQVSWQWKERGDSIKVQILQIREATKKIVADLTDQDVQRQATVYDIIFTVILLLMFFLAAVCGRSRTMVLISVLILYVLYIQCIFPRQCESSDDVKEQILQIKEDTKTVLADVANQDMQGQARPGIRLYYSYATRWILSGYNAYMHSIYSA